MTLIVYVIEAVEKLMPSTRIAPLFQPEPGKRRLGNFLQPAVDIISTLESFQKRYCCLKTAGIKF